VSSEAPPPRRLSGPRPGQLALVVGVGILIWIIPRPATVDPRAWRLLAIFVATVVGLVARPLPMGAVSLIGLAIALATRTLTTAEALSGFSNATVWLVVTAFFIAAGFIKTGLGARIAYRLVASFGGSTLGLSYSLVASDLILAPMIPSNTARAGGVIFPILQSLAAAAPAVDPARRGRTNAFLTLVAYNATVITSAMFITSMVANPLVVQLALDQGIAISWNLWAGAAVVPGVVSLMVIPLVIYRLCPPGAVMSPNAQAAAKTAADRLGPITRDEKLTGAISIALLMAWIFGPTLGLDVTAATLLAVAMLILTGVLSWQDISANAEAWNTLVWFAVLLTMATFLGEFGLIKWFTPQVESLFAGIGWLAGLLGLSFVYFYTHYFFASITAHVSAMYAPFLAVAIALGAPPLLAALLLAYFSSLFASLTHYGTASGPLIFSGGHVSLYAWWRVGLVVSFVNIAIWLGIGATWWRLLGLW
jgi:divalent anion:Na+ symporter, DASS family